MQSIRTHLARNYFFVLALGMLLAGTLTWLTVERLYVDTQTENLLAQANLMAKALQGSPLPSGPIQPYSQTLNVAPGIHTRLLSETGAVVVGLPLAEGFTQAPAAEQYASIPTSDLVQRPEIQSALHGISATALRRILGNRRVLYAAAPIYGDAGKIVAVVYLATPLPPAGLPTNSVLQIIGAMLIALLLSTLAATLLARKISRPLEGLAGAANAISRGDLQQNIDIESNVMELQHLKQTFYDMQQTLRDSDEAKKTFIADVTHELRTPLTVIKGTIETLEDGALDDIQGRSPLLLSMHRETDRLIRLVNELLVLTRADAGSLQLHLQPVDLFEVVRSRCEVFSNLASQKQIRLDVIQPASETTLAEGPSLRARADPDRLSQVIDNLLSNAIRYSPENSTITINIKPARQGIECCVMDQGPGIPAEHLPHIFERFYRAESSRNRKDGGTGLGLAITKALVNAQGGSIHAQSSLGQGTAITFYLPAV